MQPASPGEKIEPSTDAGQVETIETPGRHIKKERTRKVEKQNREDFLAMVKAAIAAMIDVCGDNIYLLYESAYKAAYKQGYDDGMVDQLERTIQENNQAAAQEILAGQNPGLEQQAADREKDKEALKPKPVIDGPENYRHALAKPGLTMCGIGVPEIIKLEMTTGDRVTCPTCLERTAEYLAQSGPLT